LEVAGKKCDLAEHGVWQVTRLPNVLSENRGDLLQEKTMGTGRRHEFVPSKGKTAGRLVMKEETKKPREPKPAGFVVLVVVRLS
jgi:hypothetical protein